MLYFGTASQNHAARLILTVVANVINLQSGILTIKEHTFSELLQKKSNSMLYIISGSSRSGKTIMAKRILAKKGISYLSLDWLVMGFTNGIPEYGIHDKLFPNEIAKRSWSFLKAMLESMLYVEADCIIEGEAILPELIIELLDKYPNKLRICFVGYSYVTVENKVNDIKKNSLGKSDWLIDKSDKYIIDHVNNMIAHSKEIEKSCKENNMRYFDTSRNFEGEIENAIAYLLE